MSPRRWLPVSRRKCVLQCSDGSSTPGCDATYSLQARRQTRRRATANCRHGTDHTANIVAISTKPAKTQERGLHERQRGSRAFLCGGKPVAQKEREHVGNGARRRQRAATGTIIACFFFVKENMFRSCFFYRPRMKSVQQVPHRLTVHMTSACCWELKSLMLIPSVWAEKRALLSAPILQGKGCVPEGLSNSHEKQSRRWAHGPRDQPFAAAGSSTSDSGTSNMRQELISPRAGKGRCWKVRRL